MGVLVVFPAPKLPVVDAPKPPVVLFDPKPPLVLFPPKRELPVPVFVVPNPVVLFWPNRLEPPLPNPPEVLLLLLVFEPKPPKVEPEVLPPPKRLPVEPAPKGFEPNVVVLLLPKPPM